MLKLQIVTNLDHIKNVDFQLYSAKINLDNISLYSGPYVVIGHRNIYWISLSINVYCLQSPFLLSSKPFLIYQRIYMPNDWNKRSKQQMLLIHPMYALLSVISSQQCNATTKRFVGIVFVKDVHIFFRIVWRKKNVTASWTLC